MRSVWHVCAEVTVIFNRLGQNPEIVLARDRAGSRPCWPEIVLMVEVGTGYDWRNDRTSTINPTGISDRIPDRIRT
jgi:hypothetical protein